jgi:hypothetical protein
LEYQGSILNPSLEMLGAAMPRAAEVVEGAPGWPAGIGLPWAWERVAEPSARRRGQAMHTVSSSPSPLLRLLFYAGVGIAYGHGRSSRQSRPDRLLASTHGKVFVQSNDQCNGMETELLRLSRGRETWRKQAAESTSVASSRHPLSKTNKP